MGSDMVPAYPKKHCAKMIWADTKPGVV